MERRSSAVERRTLNRGSSAVEHRTLNRGSSAVERRTLNRGSSAVEHRTLNRGSSPVEHRTLNRGSSAVERRTLNQGSSAVEPGFIQKVECQIQEHSRTFLGGKHNFSRTFSARHAHILFTTSWLPGFARAPPSLPASLSLPVPSCPVHPSLSILGGG